MSEIKGFGVLPVQVATTKHYIYFKKHESKASTASRSLFLCNLPLQTSHTTIKKFLQNTAIGATVAAFVPSALTDSAEDVYIDLVSLTTDPDIAKNLPQPDEGTRLPKNCGVVTFVDTAAQQLALALLKKLATAQKTSQWPLNDDPTSVRYVDALHRRVCDPEKLSEEVALALANFDRAEQDAKDNLQAQTMVDEDGFTLVVGSNRKTKLDILGRQKAVQEELQKAAKKMKKKEKADFYRFQLRQQKKEEMNELLMKFKADQEKVRVMRERKRFRPY